MLGVSMLGISIAQGGLLPTQITALGISLNAQEQRIILVLLGLVCLYYLAAFLVYALSDFTSWQVAIRDSIVAAWQAPGGDEVEDDDAGNRAMHMESFFEKHHPFLHVSGIFVRPVSKVRALFEFLVPPIVGIYAVIVLFSTRAAA
ncbi:hypothetical protein [Ramlibacter sp. PS4R-6]|uniref:hypothetical protein n=1 Tax=Ramlibacter sp. PS4R-6 TaxID=3133438 RepID=UPI0030B53C9C